MTTIGELIGRVQDEGLRLALEKEVKRLAQQKKFGLVFEEHLPEATPLHGIRVKVGMTVVTSAQDGGALFTVREIAGGVAKCVAAGSFSRGERGEHGESVGRVEVERGSGEGKSKSEKVKSEELVDFRLDEIVPVARFGEPIYPCLEKLDAIEHGGGDLWHTLIQADNYHALQLLEYLYPGQVDCIYIDPPYNTGARDWKYNNDYVDKDDAWRHSKWLSMMQKRLAIAKRLLNPKDSVLIVTIDEKEYLHLGMLLEEMFPEARIQMVSDVINRTGSVRQNMFARADEYIYFVLFGAASAQFTQNDMLNPVEEKKGTYQHLIRGGANGKRERRPNLFYPIFFNVDTGRFVSVGSAIDKNVDRTSVRIPEGCFAVWPLMQNGTECTWGCTPEKFMEKLAKGYISFGRWEAGDKNRWIGFLQSGMEDALENGLIENLGKDANGSIILGKSLKSTRALTVWNQVSHDAGAYGSTLLNQFFPDRRFSYPKSLYSTHDAIRFFVANKPNALIVDFFAGSGTTLHAVNLLNAEDGGKRRCILVTNNEVSDAEEKEFRKRGVKPGDAEWESRGIAQYVTWPRTTCSIRGVNVKGEALKGEYITSGPPGGRPLPMREGFKANCAFFKLGFVDPTAVSLGRKFRELLPLLWLKAGAVGRCPHDAARAAREPYQAGRSEIAPYLVWPENKMAVLFEESQFAGFRKAVRAAKGIGTVYLVTDYEPAYRAMAKQFAGAATYQLHRDYLDSFRLNVRRG